LVVNDAGAPVFLCLNIMVHVARRDDRQFGIKKVNIGASRGDRRVIFEG
jgi:hypothetical protein